MMEGTCFCMFQMPFYWKWTLSSYKEEDRETELREEKHKNEVHRIKVKLKHHDLDQINITDWPFSIPCIYGHPEEKHTRTHPKLIIYVSQMGLQDSKRKLKSGSHEFICYKMWHTLIDLSACPTISFPCQYNKAVTTEPEGTEPVGMISIWNSSPNNS